MRFERVSQAGARVDLAQAAGALHGIGSAPGLDQRVRGGQRIGFVAVQIRRLLEGLRGQRPVVALGVALPFLPAAVGAGMGMGRR